MFGNKAGPTRIYAYKASAPTEGGDRVERQVRLAHLYRNTLVHLERRRRRLVDEAVARRSPDVPALKGAWEAADAEVGRIGAEIKARNAARGSRRSTPEDRAGLALARQRKAVAYRSYKDARDRAFADEALRGELGEVDAADLAARKLARKDSGLFWGTYLLVEQSLGGIRSGAPPRFSRWPAEGLFARRGEASLAVTGEGAVAVQVQSTKPLTWADALRCEDSRLRVELLPLGEHADPASVRSATDRRAIVWIRVGSAGKRLAPVWAKVATRLHRMPPEDGRIKWAYLHRGLVGKRVAWELQFVLERDSWVKPGLAVAGTVGVDLNWRSLPEGLRVAYALGDDGREHTLFIPREWLPIWTKVASLESIRGRNFNGARDALAAWLDGHDAPAWLADCAAYLRLWRSAEKLAAVVWRWKDERFDGDAEVYPAMEAWRRQDRHLDDWARAQHRKIVRRRDDLYRHFAAALAYQYRTVRVEDCHWGEVKAVPGPTDESKDAARVYGQMSAAGRLRQVIEEAAAQAERVPAANTTRRCHACGHLEDFDRARELVHTCGGCGATWDQDRNAAVWILRGGAEPRAADAEDAA